MNMYGLTNIVKTFFHNIAKTSLKCFQNVYQNILKMFYKCFRNVFIKDHTNIIRSVFKTFIDKLFYKFLKMFYFSSGKQGLQVFNLVRFVLGKQIHKHLDTPPVASCSHPASSNNEKYLDCFFTGILDNIRITLKI